MFRQNSRENRNVRRAKKSSGNVKFQCLGATETNRSGIWKMDLRAG
jgi:hypothetical protein